ncbi:Alb1-domain-containing protein [Scheffersomyces coipomensis]|uniref:Alb1-domain-containing protein n=1 Tax=Scheffersomyces coipomensis TaxID=1788519 RepID=UPI00315D79DC
MAKKISKRSRAARRGEIADEGEAKELSNIAKPESNDVRKSIIRTTIKNENLLMKKMEDSKIRKAANSNKKKSNALRSKVERNDKLSGVLAGKIEQSIARAKYVQTTRKSGWERINKSITIASEISIIDTASKDDKEDDDVAREKTAEEIEKEAEDAYVRDFYGEDKPEGKEEEEESVPIVSLSNNRFALLEETES